MMLSWQDRNGDSHQIQDSSNVVLITNKDLLPIKGVGYGPWKSNLEVDEIKLTINPMTCSKRAVVPKLETCLDHKYNGDPPGYYILKQGDILNVAFCDSTGQATDMFELFNSQDLCSEMNYKVIKDSSRKFEEGIKGSHCDAETYDYGGYYPGFNADWDGEGWYRIMPPAGTKLYNQTISEGASCNSEGTGYYLGEYPEIKGATLENGKVCFGLFGDSCSQQQQIKIKNCGSYFLYYLKNLPCNYRYCTQ